MIVYDPRLSNPLAEARAIGDRMQSEACRVIEWVLAQPEPLPYEVHQAALEVESAVEDWTNFRRRETR